MAAPVITAPAGLWFEAIDIHGFAADGGPKPGNIYDPSFHEISFVWTVKGTDLAPFDAPQNMIPDWNRAGRAYGKKVALFFPMHGQYTVELWARDRNGVTATATHSFQVLDADQHYAGARTICLSVDPVETWTAAPSGATRVTSLRALSGALSKTNTPARVLFKRGQQITGLGLRIENNRLGHVDAWGDGPRPVLRPTQGDTMPMVRLRKRSRMNQFTVANLDFRGEWDTTTERGFSTTSPITWKQSRADCHYTVWNCQFDGFDHVDLEISDDVNSTILIGNSVVTNWRNYGFLMRSGKARFAMAGMRVAQHVDALHGSGKAGALSNNHGPVRIPDCAEVYIGVSDFFSRSGWSALAGELADQPCLRLNTSGAPNRLFVLDRIVCEGGAHVINMGGSNKRVEENPGNYLIDKALLIGTSKTISPFVAAEFGGLTLRNMIGVLPDSPRRHHNRWQGAIRARIDNPGPNNNDTPVAIYSSSVLNLLSRKNDPRRDWPFETGLDNFRNLTVENNVFHTPENRAAVNLDEPMPGIQPRFRGVRYNFRNSGGKLAKAIPPGHSFLVPYSEITEDTEATEGRRPTSQDYWLAVPDRFHMLSVRGVRRTLYAVLRDFTVQFGKQGVEVTNQSSHVWKAEARWTLRLDRASLIPPMDRRYASPAQLPLPRPAHPASMVAGYHAYDDFLTHPRGAAPSQGAIQHR